MLALAEGLGMDFGRFMAELTRSGDAPPPQRQRTFPGAVPKRPRKAK